MYVWSSLWFLFSFGTCLRKTSEFEWISGDADIFVLGDIHGDYDNMIGILKSGGCVDSNGSWSGGKALLVQTGDITDKGPDSKKVYEYLRELKKEAMKAGGDVILVLGNHDVMNLCHQFDYANPIETRTYGGLKERIKTFSQDGEYGKYLRTLPLLVKINNFVIVHAGILPHHAEMDFNTIHELFIEELELNCTKGNKTITTTDGPLWTRKLSLGPESIACKILKQSLKHLRVDFIVVGHTVTESRKIELRCGGKLVMVDTGLSKMMGNSPRLLHLSKNNGAYEISINKKKRKLHKIPLLRTIIPEEKEKEKEKEIQPHKIFHKKIAIIATILSLILSHLIHSFFTKPSKTKKS